MLRACRALLVVQCSHHLALTLSTRVLLTSVAVLQCQAANLLKQKGWRQEGQVSGHVAVHYNVNQALPTGAYHHATSTDLLMQTSQVKSSALGGRTQSTTNCARVSVLKCDQLYYHWQRAARYIRTGSLLTSGAVALASSCC
jgi:hypothetical protein